MPIGPPRHAGILGPVRRVGAVCGVVVLVSLGCAETAGQCLAGQDRCGEACVDLRVDWGHCGACGRVCGVGAGCFGGACRAPRPMRAPRAGHGVVVGPDGRVCAVGGDQAVPATGSVECFAPESNRWLLLPSLLDPSRTWFTAVNVRGALLAIGGEAWSIEGPALDTVEILEPSAGTWSPSAKLETKRARAAVAVGADERIYAFWGYSKGNPAPAVVPTVEVFDGDRWTTEPAAPPTHVQPRWGAVAVRGADARIYLLGGCNNLEFDAVSTVNAYDPETKAWSDPPDMNHPHCGGAAVLASDGRIFYFGGTDVSGMESAVVEAYDSKQKLWKDVAVMPEPRRDFAAAVAPDGRIHLVGGYVFPFAVDSTLVYDPATDRWAL